MLQVDKYAAVRETAVAHDLPRVLLVQSDPDLCEVLARACEQAGLSVHVCSTVGHAMEACRRCTMELIVVGWMVEGFFADDLLPFFETALSPRSLPTTLVLSRMSDADTRDCLRPDLPIHGVLTRPAKSEECVAWAPSFAMALKRIHACMTI
jgi:DNA-binding response OmpR family regulator